MALSHVFKSKVKSSHPVSASVVQITYADWWRRSQDPIPRKRTCTDAVEASSQVKPHFKDFSSNSVKLYEFVYICLQSVSLVPTKRVLTRSKREKQKKVLKNVAWGKTVKRTETGSQHHGIHS